MSELTGRCLCGAMTYSSSAEPLFTAICHCTDCQRQTGSAFSLVTAVPAGAFALHGETAATFRTTGEDHGLETERVFCSACGSPLISRSPKLPDAVLIKAGTLDDPSALEPRLEIWGRSAHPWFDATAGRPRLERGPQPPAAD